MARKNCRIILFALLCLLPLQGCSVVISDNTVTEEEKETLTDYDTTFDASISSTVADGIHTITLSGSKDISITSAGSYLLSGTLNASIIVDVSKDETVQLFLDGVTISSNSFAAIYVVSAQKVILTLMENSINSISDSASYVQRDDNNVDALIFSKDDLIINGEGTLNLSSSFNHGIVGKDNVEIHDGNIDINVSGQGICGKDALKIKGGSLNIVSSKAALKSDNEEDAYCGLIYIAGGSITLNSTEDAIHAEGKFLMDDGILTINTNDDGIHAEGELTVNGGTISIQSSYEGLEGQYLSLNGGEISIVARDDGINAVDYGSASSDEEEDSVTDSFSPFGFGLGFGFNTGTDCSISFNGSNIYINASGDGIDSNGSAEVNGGTVVIFGPSNSADAAFDYETGGYAYGGELIAVGTSGMATSFSSSSTQCNLLYNLSTTYAANTRIQIISTDQKVIFDLTSIRSFNSLLITSSELNVNDTITLLIGEDSYTCTLSSITNSSSKGSSQQGFGFGNSGTGKPSGGRGH